MTISSSLKPPKVLVAEAEDSSAAIDAGGVLEVEKEDRPVSVQRGVETVQVVARVDEPDPQSPPTGRDANRSREVQRDRLLSQPCERLKAYLARRNVHVDTCLQPRFVLLGWSVSIEFTGGHADWSPVHHPPP